jgi:hypothetical protein
MRVDLIHLILVLLFAGFPWGCQSLRKPAITITKKNKIRKNKEKTEKMTTKKNIPGGWINARKDKRVIRKDSSIDNRERNLIYIYNCL